MTGARQRQGEWENECDLAAVGGDGEREGMAGSSKRRLQTLGPGIRMF